MAHRELVAWCPPEEDAHISFELEEPVTGGNTSWDQFAVNSKKFGYQSAWDEDLYTVKLDKSKVRISEAEAERITREIERGDTSNPHLAEERGLAVDDSGVSHQEGPGQGWDAGGAARCCLPALLDPCQHPVRMLQLARHAMLCKHTWEQHTVTLPTP